MTQDVGPEDVADVGADDGDSRRRGGGVLPLVALVIVIAIILWLVWQVLGRLPADSSVITVTSTSTIELDGSPARPEPELPVVAEPTAPADEGSRVPDVTGDSEGSAIQALTSAGYVVNTTYVYSDSTASGHVVQQNPSAGTVLDPGAVVNIIVSRGTQVTAMVTMPNIIGMTQSQATAKVKAAGLKPYILHGTDQAYAGRVGNQWPLGGTELPKGSEGFIQVMIVR